MGAAEITAQVKNTVPFVVLIDQRTGALTATIVQKKGADAYTITKLSTFMERLGYKKVILTTGNEAFGHLAGASRARPQLTSFCGLGSRAARPLWPAARRPCSW